MYIPNKLIHGHTEYHHQPNCLNSGMELVQCINYWYLEDNSNLFIRLVFPRHIRTLFSLFVVMVVVVRVVVVRVRVILIHFYCESRFRDDLVERTRSDVCARKSVECCQNLTNN